MWDVWYNLGKAYSDSTLVGAMELILFSTMFPQTSSEKFISDLILYCTFVLFILLVGNKSIRILASTFYISRNSYHPNWFITTYIELCAKLLITFVIATLPLNIPLMKKLNFLLKVSINGRSILYRMYQ